MNPKTCRIETARRQYLPSVSCQSSHFLTSPELFRAIRMTILAKNWQSGHRDSVEGLPIHNDVPALRPELFSAESFSKSIAEQDPQSSSIVSSLALFRGPSSPVESGRDSIVAGVVVTEVVEPAWSGAVGEE
jgi:hypothetical protein